MTTETLREYTNRLALGTDLTGADLTDLAATDTPTDNTAALAARDGWHAATIDTGGDLS